MVLLPSRCHVTRKRLGVRISAKADRGHLRICQPCERNLDVGGEPFREMKMPELSLAKRALGSRKILSSFEFSADQIEAVRHLIGRTIAEVECELIIETLTDQRGSRTEAAKVLGISIRTLRNKIHEYDERGKIVPKPAAQ